MTTNTIPNTHYCMTISLALTMLACGPQQANDGGDGFGSTGTGEETDGAAETGGPEGPIEPVGPIKCVEKIPNSVTCWVNWGLAWAIVRLPCQVANNVSAGVWSAAYDDDIEPWGPVRCHDITGTENSICLYSEFGVLLTLAGDVWLPTVSALIDQYDPVDPPCGDQCTNDPGSLGCECVADGCVEELVCTLTEACQECPPGSPGCACGIDDYCEVGSCTSGQDSDGTEWSICYPADLLACTDGACPGDAYCTDDLKCAWAG